MYTDDTEFLTQKGWKNVEKIRRYDEIAACDDSFNFHWVPSKQAGFEISPLEKPVIQCFTGKNGRFAITEDHPIRFIRLRVKKRDQYQVSYTLKQVISQLIEKDYLPAHIPTNFLEPEQKEDTGRNGRLLARMIPFVYKITPKGNVYFHIHSHTNKKQLSEFILRELKIPPESIKLSQNKSQIIIVGTPLSEWHKAAIYQSRLIIETIDSMLTKKDARKTVVRRLRFLCPRVATLLQTAMLFSTRSTLYSFTEAKSNKNHCLTIEPKNQGVNFRSKAILLPSSARAVTTVVPHPITRWKGSVVAL